MFDLAVIEAGAVGAVPVPAVGRAVVFLLREAGGALVLAVKLPNGSVQPIGGAA